MKRALAPLAALAGVACSHAEPARLPPPTSAAPTSSATTAASDPPSKLAADAGAPVVVQKRPVDPAASTGADEFTQALFGQVRKTEKANFALAGGNLRDALVAVALGAKGKTASEFAKVLALPATPAEIAAEAKRDRAAWTDAMGDSQLVTAARLWHDASQKLAPDYLARAQDVLAAEPEAVSFATGAAAARKTINDWAKDKTAGKIPELLANGSVDSRTRLVATSAMYFKAAWATPFLAAGTRPEPFHVGKTEKNVLTMHRRGPIRVSQQDDRTAIDLPYAKSGISMLVVATKAASGSTAALEELYVKNGLPALQEGLELMEAALSLPKFTFRAGGSMVPALQSMGLKDPFGMSADLSGLFGGSTPLFLSAVVQRTFVAVDEKGTEAAAASAATVSIRSAPMGEVPQVKIDRPFLFFLHDSGGHVLFAGRVADPAVAP